MVTIANMPNKKVSLPLNVLRDIKVLLSTHKTLMSRICLFGSTLDKPFELANDIDVAIFLRAGVDMYAVKDAFCNINLSYPVCCCTANGGYTGVLKPEKMYYHFVLLREDELNETFMKINEGRLLELDFDMVSQW